MDDEDGDNVSLQTVVRKAAPASTLASLWNSFASTVKSAFADDDEDSPAPPVELRNPATPVRIKYTRTAKPQPAASPSVCLVHALPSIIPALLQNSDADESFEESMRMVEQMVSDPAKLAPSFRLGSKYGSKEIRRQALRKTLDLSPLTPRSRRARCAATKSTHLLLTN